MWTGLSSWWREGVRRRWPLRRLSLERLEDRTLLQGSPLDSATPLPFTAFDTAHAAHFLSTPSEVDLYRVRLAAGDRISASVSAQSSGSGLQSVLRIFDATGRPLGLDDQEGGDPSLTFQAATAGDYFVAISSAPDDNYDPTVAGSGHPGTTTGLYALDLRLTHAAFQPDVTGSSFRLGADTAVVGEAIPVTFTVENRGGAEPGAFQVQVLLANNRLFNKPTVVTTFARAELVPDATGRRFSSPTGFAVAVPPGQASGPLFVGVRIVPDPAVPDANPFDKSGVHRGSDYETLTVLTPITSVPGGTTDLSQADPGLNTRASGTLVTLSQTDTYSLTVTGSGRLTAAVAATAGTLAPRLTLLGANGEGVIQSDSGTIVQHLEAGSYALEVSARSGTGSYRLITEFVPASSPFVPVRIGSGGAGARPEVVADVNGDGIPDLVTANEFDNTVSVLLGNGDGTFQKQQTYTVGVGPVSVAVADLNGDGKPDLLVANQGTSSVSGTTVSVLLGNGDGTFQPQQAVTVGKYPSALAVADLNGDGKPDLVVANYKDNSVSVLLGNGDGTFQSQQLVTVNYGPTAVALADVNGDGKPDLIVGYEYSATVSVRLGNGDGTFQPQQTYAAGFQPASAPANLGFQPSSLAVADVNGDGKLDLIVSNKGTSNNPGTTVSVLLGNGDGTFQPQQTFAAGSQPQSVVVADVNGDGRPDLIVANTFANTVSLLLGNGDGTFQAPRAFVAGPSPVAVAVADVNGDGRPDLIAKIDYAVDAVSVLLGNGDGTFQPSPQAFASGGRPDATAVADVNGDGKPDLLVANFSGNTVGVLLGNGDGTFRDQQTFSVSPVAVSNPTAVVAADVNGDGRLDLIVTNFSATTPGSTDRGSVSVLLGNGDGTFQPAQSYKVDKNPSSVAVADVNGDGIPDLLVANQYGYDVSVLLGNGDGTFKPQLTFAAGYGPSSTAATFVGSDGKSHPIDFNGDGKPDLVVTNQGTVAHPSNTISVLLGNGDGTFQPQQTFAAGSQPQSVVVADVNGDGRPDLIVANTFANTVSLLLGNGDGTFRSGPSLDVGGAPFAVAVADVNGDGTPDVVVTSLGFNTVDVLFGNGDGTFRSGPSLDVGKTPFAVAVADVNGDGRPDLVTANSADNTLSVLLGNGDGTFTSAMPSSGVGLRNTPFLANLNGDATLDGVILDSTGNILFRKGLPGPDNPFASPQTTNATVFDPRLNKSVELTARDLTVLHTGTGSAIATTDAIPDPTILFTQRQFVYTVSLYAVAADGSVNHSTVFTSSLPPTGIFAADLTDPAGTANGLDDLIVTNSLNNTITIAFQTAPGVFDPMKVIELPVGAAPSDVTFVNDHGLLDVVVTDQASGDVTVLLNDDTHSFTRMERFRAGTGLFGIDSSNTVHASSRNQSVSLTAGSFTGSGGNDLVVVNRGAHSFSVLPNDGSGGFADPQAALTTSTSDGPSINDQPGPVVAGAFSGGNLDVAILMKDTAQVWIYTGDGHGHFTHTFSIAAGSLPTGLSVVQNPQTGFLDLLVGNPFGDILRLQGNGDGTFQAPSLTGNRVSLDVRTVAGQPQALVANQQQNHVIVETPAPGSPQFVPTQTVVADTQTPFAPPDARFFALNQNDSTLDAVVLSGAGNSVQVYRPAAAGPGYLLQTSSPVGTNPVSVTIQDVNGDGIPDMLVVNKGSNDVSVLFGHYDAPVSAEGGNGVWFATEGPRLKSGGSSPIAVTVSDVTGRTGLGGPDGIPDLIVTNAQSGTMTVLPGVGQGFFNDTNPQVISFGNTLGTPSVVNGVGVVATGDDRLIAFDLANPAGSARTVFTAAAPVNAVQALPGGAVVVALAGGTVEELLPNASGALTTVVLLEPLTGVPLNPSALAVLETAAGLEVLVTDAGTDQVFVFVFTGPQLPEIVLPVSAVPAGPGVEITVPTGAPETLVITLVAAVFEFSAQTAPGSAAAETETVSAAVARSESSSPGRSSGEGEEDQEQEIRAEGEDPVDVEERLRKLDLHVPRPEDDPDEVTPLRPTTLPGLPEAFLAGLGSGEPLSAWPADALAALPDWAASAPPVVALQHDDSVRPAPGGSASEKSEEAPPKSEEGNPKSEEATPPSLSSDFGFPSSDFSGACDEMCPQRSRVWDDDLSFLAVVAVGGLALSPTIGCGGTRRSEVEAVPQLGGNCNP